MELFAYVERFTRLLYEVGMKHFDDIFQHRNIFTK